MIPKPGLAKPQINLKEAAGQALVTHALGYDQDCWLVFERGFVVLRASSQYGGGCDLDEEFGWSLPDNIETLVSLELWTREQADGYRVAYNEDRRLRHEENERQHYESLRKKFEK